MKNYNEEPVVVLSNQYGGCIRVMGDYPDD
jgi:hypothetical protein